MSAIRRFLMFAGLVALAVPVAAEGQVRVGSAIKPAALAAAPGASGKWTCVSRTVVEIAPVSYDTAGEPNAWVRVHRIQGEIVADERISRLEIEQFRRLPCGAPESDLGGVALVG
jgi:hypothetical protein